MVQPVAVCGSETWVMTGMEMKWLGTWESRILRRTRGPVVQQGMRRIRINGELREPYKDLDIKADIKWREWIGLDM